MLYLRAPVNETLPVKTLSGRRLDQTCWARDSEGLLDSPVLISVHVREDLLVVVRRGFAKEDIYLTHCTLAQRLVGVLEWRVYCG